jgi:chromosome segregation ATPase
MSKISPFVYSRIVFWLLLLCGLLFADSRCNRVPKSVVPEESQSKKIKAQQAILTERYETKLRNLQRHSDSLERQMKIQQKQMLVYRQQVSIQKLKVQQRISRQSERRDTLQKLMDCDSLSEEVQVYIALAESRDSLCQAQVQNLSAQLSAKDTAQLACDEYSEQLNHQLSTCTDAQQQLEKNVASLNKKLKHKKRLNKLLTAGALILSGVVLSGLSH